VLGTMNASSFAVSIKALMAANLSGTVVLLMIALFLFYKPQI
jgi:hypothetical protein